MSEERSLARNLGLKRAEAAAYYRRGLKAFEDGDLENAILDLSEAIYYDRGFAEYYSTRGLFHVEADEIEEAQVDLAYALKLNKRQWLAHYALGMIDFKDGEFEDAAKKFSEAIKLRPDRPELWYYRAVTNHEIGDDAQAISDMERAESLFPPGDKRRKDAAAWIKEFKKSAVTPLPPDGGKKSLPAGVGGAPPLGASKAPQLNPPSSKSLAKVEDDVDDEDEDDEDDLEYVDEE